MSYSSKPGDARRSGRANPQREPDNTDIDIEFVERADGCIYAMRRKVEVGIVCQYTPAGRAPGWTWLCQLPGHRPMPQFAATRIKAEEAMRRAVKDWFAAAGVVPAPRKRASHVWRADNENQQG